MCVGIQVSTHCSSLKYDSLVVESVDVLKDEGGVDLRHMFVSAEVDVVEQSGQG